MDPNAGNFTVDKTSAHAEMIKSKTLLGDTCCISTKPVEDRHVSVNVFPTVRVENLLRIAPIIVDSKFVKFQARQFTAALL